MFRVAIVGGEGFGDYPTFERKCINIVKDKAKTEGLLILSTGDEFVERFAQKFGVNVQLFYCDWKTNKKNALKVRNERMLSNCDAIIMFNDRLKDTMMIYNMAVEMNLPNRKIG